MGTPAPTPFGFARDCPSLAGSETEAQSFRSNPCSAQGPAMCLHFQPLVERPSDWGKVLVAPSGPCCVQVALVRLSKRYWQIDQPTENFLSPSHMGGEWVFTTLPSARGEAKFFQGLGKARSPPPHPSPPRDTRPHLLSFRHQALRSSRSRTNQALPPTPGAPVSSQTPQPSLPAPPGVPAAWRPWTAAPGFPSIVKAAILGSAPACMRHFHTHTHFLR